MLNSFLAWLRTVTKLSYLWFLEFQERDAPHVHILLNINPSIELHQRIAEKWADKCQVFLSVSEREKGQILWQHKRAENFQEIEKDDGAKRYALKYATKPKQKQVPSDFQDVGRFYGSSRDVYQSIPEGIEIEMTESEVRSLLISKGFPADDWRDLPKICYLRTTDKSQDSET